MKKDIIIKEIENFQNPYPKDIFRWDNKEDAKITKGRLHEFIHHVVENTKEDIIKIIREIGEEAVMG